MGENRGKELTTSASIFHQLASQCSTTIYCQRNSIFHRPKKKISIHYLTGQNQGLSKLKNIWRVIMTGDLLSVIFSPVKDRVSCKI